MNQPDHIQAELAPLAPTLAGLKRTTPYQVPVGYFDGLEATLVEQALLLEPVEPLAKGGVPDGYFEQLPGLLLEKIRNEEHALELQSVAPLLATLPREMPYHLPADYFNRLDPATVLQPATARTGLLRQITRANAWRAAAAVVLLVALFSIWKMNNRAASESTLAAVPAAAPATTPADSAAIHQSLTAVDDTLLVSYFADLGIAEEASTLTIYMDTTFIQETLASFSEEELQSQLQELPLTEVGI